jgi:protein-tyrosine-phosphatase
MKVLFVCTGNICRSPMAAAIARDLLERAGRTDVVVSSAGTYALVGDGATGDALATAEEHGLHLDDHRARQLTADLVADADLVIGMRSDHADAARRLGARRVITLEQEIDDPYGCGLDAYRDTWTLLAQLIPRALES